MSFSVQDRSSWVFRVLQLTIKSGVILEKICEYLYYNEKHKNATNVPDMEIPPELCLELLMAADYLHGMLILSQFRGF